MMSSLKASKGVTTRKMIGGCTDDIRYMDTEVGLRFRVRLRL